MTVNLVTALFDINREKRGDGRTMQDYLKWFEETLKIKCDMTIFVEFQNAEFVREKRKNSEYKTDIIIEKFSDCPYFKYANRMQKIIDSPDYKNKIKDPKRIECYLAEYNIIQYSKFEWLAHVAEMNFAENIFWIDAGCSRFFDGFDINNPWPNLQKIPKNKLTIQGSGNFSRKFPDLKDDHFWDNECCLVGTLFGGSRETVVKIAGEINEIFEEMIKMDCVNNEQIALAILAKRKPELFNIIKNESGNHLPLFKFLT